MKQVLGFILLSLASLSLSAQEMNCANGKLMIEASGTNTYKATISDKAFLDEIKKKLTSKVEAKCPDCENESIMTTPRLPPNTRLETVLGEKVAVVSSLKFYPGYKKTPNTYKTDELQTRLLARDGGMDLLVEGFEIERSHPQRTYFIQHWWFPNCQER